MDADPAALVLIYGDAFRVLCMVLAAVTAASAVVVFVLLAGARDASENQSAVPPHAVCGVALHGIHDAGYVTAAGARAIHGSGGAMIRIGSRPAEKNEAMNTAANWQGDCV